MPLHHVRPPSLICRCQRSWWARAYSETAAHARAVPWMGGRALARGAGKP